MNEYIDLFVKCVLRNPDLEDADILEYLIKNNVPEHIAIDVISFVPISFCRMYLKESGVKFSNIYFVKYNDVSESHFFTDNIVFQQSNNYYQEYILKQVSQEDLITIVGRSADFDAIIQALEKNIDLEKIVINPMIFLY